jgi:hypothetical protein
MTKEEFHKQAWVDKDGRSHCPRVRRQGLLNSCKQCPYYEDILRFTCVDKARKEHEFLIKLKKWNEL